MNKQIVIIGSICAVVILLAVSFTSVIGYSSNISNFEKASPLYNIRTKKAIKDESKTFSTFDYIGKGKNSVVYIPKLEDKIDLLIDRIKNMDSSSFEKLKITILKQALYYNKIKNINMGEMIKLLKFLEDKPSGFTDAEDCTSKPFKNICIFLYRIVFAFKFSLALGIVLFLFTLLILGGFTSQPNWLSCDAGNEYCTNDTQCYTP